ncbi:O-antigen ligase family protein [Vibrio sp. ZSDZ65]|uniref:O-antigen ligase family protein n=1 Tax=Vibrio qingdaonensis TaxID=2829491 RepID=A0A9X3CRF1_9VIBR|nr:O-antigen ligase family protein [Vibrio qingdaonensis]MCW8348063.1 O-antigen ligase family protein [Vibrio qingdaonensis]
MITNATYNRITAFTVAFTFLTLFVSKAGMNIAFALILLTAITGALSKQPLLSDIKNLRRLSYLCFGMYILGIVVTIVYPVGMQDLAWFARKGAFFLLLPFLIPMVERHHSKAFKALLIGALIAFSYSAYLYLTDQARPDGRVQSFWDIGRWSEIIAYLIAILIPLVYFKGNMNAHQRAGVTMLSLVAFVALLASGSRGPLLFLVVSLLLFLAFQSHRLFIGSLIVGIAVLILMKDSSTFGALYERITSISSSSNHSNNARLLMWHNGIEFSIFNLQEHLGIFLFGTGDSQLKPLYTEYLNSVGSIEEMQRSVSNQMSLSDFHNHYIDNFVRMGLIYSVSYLTMIMFIISSLVTAIKHGNKRAWAGLTLISTYLGIGLVYSNNLEFQTAIFLFMLTLILTWPNTSVTSLDFKEEK